MYSEAVMEPVETRCEKKASIKDILNMLDSLVSENKAMVDALTDNLLGSKESNDISASKPNAADTCMLDTVVRLREEMYMINLNLRVLQDGMWG